MDELLMPADLLAEGSVLRNAVEAMTPEDCGVDDPSGNVEIIGWLYQYYISERKNEVMDGFKKNHKAGADEIPAATQLFTPDWIVRYLVQNTVGRLLGAVPIQTASCTRTGTTIFSLRRMVPLRTRIFSTFKRLKS